VKHYLEWKRIDFRFSFRMADLLNGTLIISEDPVRLPLIGSPWPSLTIVSLYLLFVLKLGRKFMENRKPYDLRRVIRAYNIMQIVYNGVILIAVGT